MTNLKLPTQLDDPLLNSVWIASETMVKCKSKREHEKENERDYINNAKNLIKSEEKNVNWEANRCESNAKNVNWDFINISHSRDEYEMFSVQLKSGRMQSTKVGKTV